GPMYLAEGPITPIGVTFLSAASRSARWVDLNRRALWQHRIERTVASAKTANSNGRRRQCIRRLGDRPVETPVNTPLCCHGISQSRRPTFHTQLNRRA